MEGLFPVRDRPEVLPISDVVEETPTIKSLYVESLGIASESNPGQFLMVWVLGVDEVPMAVSTVRDDRTLGITVENVGEATSRLHELKVGDFIGLRGPYGHGFDLSGENLLVVGGGCGSAPLLFAAEVAVKRGKNVKVVLTAKDEDELLFRSSFEKMDLDLVLGTEDGSVGIEGLTTDVLESADFNTDFDSCLVCGPEKMMVATAEMVEGWGVPVQVSLNRYVKCGIGLCGQCSIDPSGKRVCVDGPVFEYEEIKGGEFGKYRRSSTGSRIDI